jgi:hypothetical protein
MACLQKHTVKLRQQSPAQLQRLEGLPSSIHGIAQQFLDDVTVLKGCFPTNASPTLLERVSFTLEKRRIREVTQRLQQRQSSASLALELLGRYVVAVTIGRHAANRDAD